VTSNRCSPGSKWQACEIKGGRSLTSAENDSVGRSRLITNRRDVVSECSTAHSMGNRRTAKVAEAIREVVSSTVLFELRDPRIQNVTVLSVEVPIDLRTAKIFVSVMGDDAQQRLTMSGLNAARGFLQSKVGDRVNLRFVPILSFELDDGVKKSVEATRILQELAEERAAREAQDGPLETTIEDGVAEAEATKDETTGDEATDDETTDHNDLPEVVSDRIDGG